MTSIANALTMDKWGKETEKQLDNENVESWRKKMYLDTIPWGYDRFAELLEKYSMVPRDEVEAEIFRIREKAWELAKYPCIGHFTYLRLLEFDDADSEMQRAIGRLKAPDSQENFLELGGFIFQTIRQLAFEGVDSARLYGTDLHAEFIELGYEQFRDRETLKATLVAGDILLPDEEYAACEMAHKFDGRMTIVHASNFFHLFSWKSQLLICERIVRFFRLSLSPETPAVLFGTHMGSLKPGEIEMFSIFLHDKATFQSLWDEVGANTGTRWEVSMHAEMTPPRLNAFGEDSRIMHYVVRQVVD